MDEMTKEITELIRETDITERPELEEAARRALADYLAAYMAGVREEAPKQLAAFLKSRRGETPVIGFSIKTTPEAAALLYGFTSHYLDFDDAEANVMGHASTVLFSALLPMMDEETAWSDFLSAYIAGLEVEGLLGRIINPGHKHQGWHPTATLGPIGAAAAIARLKHLSLAETAELLSLGATQSAGLGLEAGTDTKPLHSGFAAADALRGYELLTLAHLSSSDAVFHRDSGWVKTISGKELTLGYFRDHWLHPGEIISPGLWMKEHPYCSAGIPGAAAVKALYQEGLRMDEIEEIDFHFPPGKSYSLHYHRPLTGQAGRFSMEFVAWQILTYEDVKDELFKEPHVPPSFLEMLPRFHIVEDLPTVLQETRRIVVTGARKGGTTFRKEIPHPPGSPEKPFTWEELERKLSLGIAPERARRLISVFRQERVSWKDVEGLLMNSDL